jgi:hypothetical protein
MRQSLLNDRGGSREEVQVSPTPCAQEEMFPALTGWDASTVRGPSSKGLAASRDEVRGGEAVLTEDQKRSKGGRA